MSKFCSCGIITADCLECGLPVPIAYPALVRDLRERIKHLEAQRDAAVKQSNIDLQARRDALLIKGRNLEYNHKDGSLEAWKSS